MADERDVQPPPSSFESAGEERYRRLLASVTDYVYTVDIEAGRPVRTTHGPGCVAVTGYTAEQYEADANLWYRMIHDDDKAAVVAQARAVLNGHEAVPLEHRILHPDGSIRWVRNTPVPRRAPDGTLLAYDGLITDVTARRVAEEALRESEATYRTLFEVSADAIFLEELDGTVLDCNGAACRLYGYAKDELIGRSAVELLPQHVRTTLPELVSELIARGSLEIEAENLNRDGEVFPCEVSLQLVTVGGTQRVLAYIRNIAERKRREEEIRRLNARLEQHVAELEAANVELDAFSYSVSHDLRTPLVLIDGFARVLAEEAADSLAPEAMAHVERIHDNAERMRRLLDSLLTFSHLSFGPLQKQPVDTRELVRQALDDLEGERQGRQVQVTVGQLPACQADPSLLKLVFWNLLSNALKFTRRRELAVIEVGWAESESRGAYYVRDNGVGFDMQRAREVFGVFRRLHDAREFEGTGVGLANAQRIVQRHGGRIWVDAAVDEGATFYFTLG